MLFGHSTAVTACNRKKLLRKIEPRKPFVVPHPVHFIKALLLERFDLANQAAREARRRDVIRRIRRPKRGSPGSRLSRAVARRAPFAGYSGALLWAHTLGSERRKQQKRPNENQGKAKR